MLDLVRLRNVRNIGYSDKIQFHNQLTIDTLNKLLLKSVLRIALVPLESVFLRILFSSCIFPIEIPIVTSIPIYCINELTYPNKFIRNVQKNH